MKKNNPALQHGKIDWMITLVPLILVIVLCLLFKHDFGVTAA